MNQQQRKYALERVGIITRQKMEEARVKYTTPEVSLSVEERKTALREGRFKIKDEIPPYPRYRDLSHWIEFVDERDAYVDQGALDQSCKMIRNEGNRIKDEIMLGDSEEALKAIKSLENLTV